MFFRYSSYRRIIYLSFHSQVYHEDLYWAPQILFSYSAHFCVSSSGLPTFLFYFKTGHGRSHILTPPVTYWLRFWPLRARDYGISRGEAAFIASTKHLVSLQTWAEGDGDGFLMDSVVVILVASALPPVILIVMMMIVWFRSLAQMNRNGKHVYIWLQWLPSLLPPLCFPLLVPGKTTYVCTYSSC